MKIRNILIMFSFITLCFISSGSILGDDDLGKDNSPSISFEDFDWLVGFWKGEAFGGIMEEIWLPAAEGSMCGIFRLITNDGVSFYEIFTITMDSGKPLLKLKHFNADLTGWEEKGDFVTFEFAGIDENELRFDGLTYKKISDDSLQIILKMKDKEGNISEEILNCHKENF